VTVVLPLAGVVACTPAMPPELLAQLADSSINCGTADVSASAPGELSYVINQWGSDYNSFCPAATVTVSDQASIGNISYSDSPMPSSSCNAFLSIPVAIDAGVIATNVAGANGIVIDAKVLSMVLQGKITSWADPAIAGINPIFELPDEPILVNKTITKEVSNSIDSWMTNLDKQNWTGIPSDFSVTDSVESGAVMMQMANEGSIALLPSSFALNNGYQLMAVAATSGVDPVIPSVETIYSASTQLESQTSSSSITAKMNYSKDPLPAEGQNEADQPWQAIYPIYEHLCIGGIEQDARSYARFSLRTSSQGYLLSYNLQGVTEDLRGKALELVSQGLPSPSPIEPDTAATP